MGLQVTAPKDLNPGTSTPPGGAPKARPAVRLPTPAALADVALIDASTAAAAACMSLSAWHEAVRRGDAPRAVIRRPRFTRYLLADVRRWLVERAAGGDAMVDDRVQAQAVKASAAAGRKRAAAAAAPKTATETKPAARKKPKNIPALLPAAR
jgi:hypothetical protein